MGMVFLIGGVIVLILGVGFIVVARSSKKHHAGLDERCTVVAEAELVDTICRTEEYMDKFEHHYHGVYAYVTKDGLRVRAENESAYLTPDGVLGPRVTIRYNPDKPTEFILSEEMVSAPEILAGFHKGGIFMLVLGVVLIAASIALWEA